MKFLKKNWNFWNFLKILKFKSFLLNFMKFYEIFEIYIVNLPEMTNRQNSGAIFRFGKDLLASVLLRQRVLLRSDSYTRKSYWGMSNAYYPMKLIDFCMKYDKWTRSTTLLILTYKYNFVNLYTTNCTTHLINSLH